MRQSYISLVLTIYISFISGSCKNNPENIIVVIGEAQDVQSPNTILNSRSLKIGLINPSRPDKPAKIMTRDFLSACSPEVSFDGKSMIFAGRRNESVPWQIWEMNLRTSKIRNISSCDENCFYPAYLPASQIVFSKMMINDSLKSQISLFKCNTDGTGEERLTFNPAAWYASTILADGRILAKCTENYHGSSESELMVLRPDGTKAELFYERSGILTGGKAMESAGKIFFTEKNGSGRPDLISVLYNTPFNSSSVLSGSNTEGEFIALNEGKEGNLLACYRESQNDNYKLYAFDPEKEGFDLIHEEKGHDLLDAVMLKTHEKPRKLPSEVDKLVKTGLLMCQDVNYPADMRGYMKPAKIGVIGIDSLLGIVEPEPDGSIYLKILADMPFRLATLDNDGKILRSCSWMVLRPNERRGCTGCHEDPEVVPGNRIPRAVKKSPVIIPVTIDKIEEKIIELE